MLYNGPMIEIIKSETFDRWLQNLKDRLGRARILARIDRLAGGNPGDHKSIRDGLCELRIDHGPGYRVYFIRRGQLTLILLAGGDKSTQDADIERALRIAEDWED